MCARVHVGMIQNRCAQIRQPPPLSNQWWGGGSRPYVPEHTPASTTLHGGLGSGGRNPHVYPPTLWSGAYRRDVQELSYCNAAMADNHGGHVDVHAHVPGLPGCDPPVMSPPRRRALLSHFEFSFAHQASSRLFQIPKKDP